MKSVSSRPALREIELSDIAQLQLQTPYRKQIGHRIGEGFLPLRGVADCKQLAIVELILSPVWIPAKAVKSIVGAISNIFSFLFCYSNFYIFNRHENLGFLKGKAIIAIGYNLASIVLTPVSMATEAVSVVTHVLHPKVQKIDFIATKLWKGFAVK